jgi:hypothetical protein
MNKIIHSFKYAFIGITEEFISRMFNNSTSLLGLTPALANKLIDYITDTVDNLNQGTKLSFTKNMTEDDLRSFIRATFDSSGSNVKLFGSLLERLVENVSVALFEIIKHKIGWIDEETFDLGGSFGDTNIHKSAIYAINPAQQFDKYHYKTGDSINLIQKFRLEKSGSGSSIQFTQDKFVDSIHRYTNTGILNRTDSTACLRKWYRGQTASGTYNIEKEISFKAPIFEKLKKFYISNAKVGYSCTILLFSGLIVLFSAFLNTENTVPMWGLWAFAISSFFPASDIVITLVNKIVSMTVGPQHLPLIKFESGVPSSLRTFVVMPILLINTKTIEEQLQQLEIHYLSNPEGQVHFAILSDWKDSNYKINAADCDLLKIAKSGIEKLNKHYKHLHKVDV